jgi:FKBP-type peptidyl-prolyl cis-trans isomerase
MIIAGDICTKSILMRRGISLKYMGILSGLLILMYFTSCNPDKKWKEMEEEEKQAIKDFLTDNDSINFELKSSGLYYHDVKVGTGLLSRTHDTAYVFYTMKFLSGTTSETNVGTEDTLIFPVNEGWLSVKGFDEGVTYMKEGGKAKFLVPSSLAFGSSGTYIIPSYTPLLFEVELVRLTKYTGSR